MIRAARGELIHGVAGMLGRTLRIDRGLPAEPAIVLGTVAALRSASIPLSGEAAPEGFLLRALTVNGCRHLVAAGCHERGVLCGVFALLRGIGLEEEAIELNEQQAPCAPLRWTNEWDSLDGTIEGGYGRRSIFFEDTNVRQDLSLVRDYARLLASLGDQCMRDQ